MFNRVNESTAKNTNESEINTNESGNNTKNNENNNNYTIIEQPDVLSDTSTQALYKLIYKLVPSKNVRCGINEAIKIVSRGEALLVVMAVDSIPKCLTEPLRSHCENYNVSYVYVSSKMALGKACMLSVDTIGCVIYTKKDGESGRILKEIAEVMR